MLIDEHINLIKISYGTRNKPFGCGCKWNPKLQALMNEKDVYIKTIFSPEHGLFGEAAAGEKVNYDGQVKSLPEVVSLYGSNRKPTDEQMKSLDIIIYDIQDVGARFIHT